MNPRFSAYLDCVRFLAAILVVLSHWAYVRFTDGYYLVIRDYNLGSDVVVIFFVLSGFVISFAATEKDKTLRRFAFSRMTRLYSVAIPALLITVLFDNMGRSVNSPFYDNTPFYNFVELAKFWFQGLTFSNHWSGNALRLGSNGPFWSLSYEAAYYILFAILMFTKGLRRILLLFISALIFGTKILLLAPAWFFGVAAYFGLKRYSNVNLSKGMRVVLILLPLMAYIGLQAARIPVFLRWLTYNGLGPDLYQSLAFSDEFLWNAIIGGLFTVHLLGVALLLKSARYSFPMARFWKWAAGASFSLYLVHYPVLQYLGAVMPGNVEEIGRQFSILAIVIGFCFVFASLFERPLPRMRRFVIKLFAKKDTGKLVQSISVE